MKKKFIVLIAVAIVAIAVFAVIFLWEGAPDIPADHEGRTTCFECHDTGANGAPQIPQSHLDKIEQGTLADNVTDCLECHHRAG